MARSAMLRANSSVAKAWSLWRKMLRGIWSVSRIKASAPGSSCSQDDNFPHAASSCSAAKLSCSAESKSGSAANQRLGPAWRQKARIRPGSVALEILHLAFVLLGRGAAVEGAQVAPLAGLGFFLWVLSRYLPDASLRIMTFSLMAKRFAREPVPALMAP